MKRITPLILLSTAILAVFLYSAQGPGPDRNLTGEDITLRAKALKKQMKGELAAKGERYEPGAFPSDWGFRQRAYPYDRINFDQVKAAVVEAQAMRIEAAKAPGALSAVWTEEGPSNIGARISDLEMHPTDPDIIYAAHASGGVHRSTDGGVNWTPITDDLPVLTIGDIAIDPQTPNTLYCGTGEASAHSFSWFGMGLYKSTDAGASWSYIGLEETRYIARVVVDPGVSPKSDL
jgi:hypothetical protein